MSRADKVPPSVYDAIGQTRLVEVNRIKKDLVGKIFAKLEYSNPGFLKKDRIPRQVIKDAENQGIR